MESHLYLVSWFGESRILSAVSMDALWKRIRKQYPAGSRVMIEDTKEKKVYVREKQYRRPGRKKQNICSLNERK